MLANVTFTPLHTSSIQTHSVEQGLSPHRDVESDVKVRLVTARVELDVSENHFCQRKLVTVTLLVFHKPFTLSHFISNSPKYIIPSFITLEIPSKHVMKVLRFQCIFRIPAKFPKLAVLSFILANFPSYSFPVPPVHICENIVKIIR